MIFVLFGALTLLVVGMFFWAARPRYGVNARNSQALAIYEDQLAELERDAARGVISEDERKAAEVEVKRRMLKVSDSDTQQRSGATGPLFVAAALVPMGAVMLYLSLGEPDVPSAPFADRVEEAQDFALLAERLRTTLLSQPDGGETEGWRLLARSYANQGQPGAAIEAYRVVLDRPDANSIDFSLAAEAMVVAAQGQVPPEARDWLNRSLELAPQNPAATYYLALALRQDGRPADALQLLGDRVAEEERFAEWMGSYFQLGQEIASAIGAEMFTLPSQRGPNAADIEVASDLSPEEQAEMIKGMVDGLASRLEEDPSDLDGWLQLGRAYAVLGNLDQARAALAEVLERADADDPRRQIAQEGLSALE
ncbi:MAG: c-type cytochrome biogenesis protein CcmI [Pseudomonadota bacterium]